MKTGDIYDLRKVSKNDREKKLLHINNYYYV